MFTGKFQEIAKIEAGQKRPLDYRFSGNYKYEYHRDKFDQIKFFEELHKLSHRIGFTQELLKIIAKIPDKNIGFVQLQLMFLKFGRLQRKEQSAPTEPNKPEVQRSRISGLNDYPCYRFVGEAHPPPTW